VRVVESSVLCIGILAKGLRKSFASHAKTILPILLEKFKEKKVPVVKALHEAIGHMQPHCFAFTDVMDEVIASAKSKV
jgi:cytoskeleton-associated protein 5